ncbi:MAG TPA: class I SAM-dependent methyltransferase, partial [Casimicrobiaceae bacterium]
VRAYYTGRIGAHGSTPRGVDWNSAVSQETRFAQLIRVCDEAGPFTLGDYGCGYAALYDHLLAGGRDCAYRGFDISEAMLEAARGRHGGDARAAFGADESVLADSDFVVASGVFNVKLERSLAEWEAYVLHTIERLADLGRRGFAFNALTSYSDPERMRADLYYANPCTLFDHCKRRFSRHVALLHDYGLYEFTILVRR